MTYDYDIGCDPQNLFGDMQRRNCQARELRKWATRVVLTALVAFTAGVFLGLVATVAEGQVLVAGTPEHHWDWATDTWTDLRTGAKYNSRMVAGGEIITPVADEAQCYIDQWGNQVCPPQQPRRQAPQPSVRVDQSAHCRVRVAGDGSTGSGTYVCDLSDGTALVITCGHLFDDSRQGITCQFPGGGRYRANVLACRPGELDLAALQIKKPTGAVPVQVAEPDHVSAVIACGYGPNNQFRAVQGRHAGRTSDGSDRFNCVVRPGDSGGGMLNPSGLFVGVIWGCRPEDGQTYATCGQPVRDLIRRFCCREQSPTEPPVAAAGPHPPARPEPSPDIDWATWEKDIRERLEKAEGGRKTLEAKLIKIETNIAVIMARRGCDCAVELAAIEKRIKALENKPTPLPPPAPTEPDAEQHVVIVADQSAPYWPRLASLIAKTQETYSGVRTAPLPAFAIGTHPQGVVYKHNTAARVVKGQYAVEDLLAALARGQAI